MERTAARFAPAPIYGLQPQITLSPFPPARLARAVDLSLPDHSKRPAFEGGESRLCRKLTCVGIECRYAELWPPHCQRGSLRGERY